MLTPFEFITSVFDKYLCHFIQAISWIERSEQTFQSQVLSKIVANAKLEHELVKAASKKDKIK